MSSITNEPALLHSGWLRRKGEGILPFQRQWSRQSYSLRADGRLELRGVGGGSSLASAFVSLHGATVTVIAKDKRDDYFEILSADGRTTTRLQADSTFALLEFVDALERANRRGMLRGVVVDRGLLAGRERELRAIASPLTTPAQPPAPNKERSASVSSVIANLRFDSRDFDEDDESDDEDLPLSTAPLPISKTARPPAPPRSTKPPPRGAIEPTDKPPIGTPPASPPASPTATLLSPQTQRSASPPQRPASVVAPVQLLPAISQRQGRSPKDSGPAPALSATSLQTPLVLAATPAQQRLPAVTPSVDAVPASASRRGTPTAAEIVSPLSFFVNSSSPVATSSSPVAAPTFIFSPSASGLSASALSPSPRLAYSRVVSPPASAVASGRPPPQCGPAPSVVALRSPLLSTANLASNNSPPSDGFASSPGTPRTQTASADTHGNYWLSPDGPSPIGAFLLSAVPSHPRPIVTPLTTAPPRFKLSPDAIAVCAVVDDAANDWGDGIASEVSGTAEGGFVELEREFVLPSEAGDKSATGDAEAGAVPVASLGVFLSPAAICVMPPPPRSPQLTPQSALTPSFILPVRAALNLFTSPAADVQERKISTLLPLPLPSSVTTTPVRTRTGSSSLPVVDAIYSLDEFEVMFFGLEELAALWVDEGGLTAAEALPPLMPPVVVSLPLRHILTPPPVYFMSSRSTASPSRVRRAPVFAPPHLAASPVSARVVHALVTYHNVSAPAPPPPAASPVPSLSASMVERAHASLVSNAASTWRGGELLRVLAARSRLISPPPLIRQQSSKTTLQINLQPPLPTLPPPRTVSVGAVTAKRFFFAREAGIRPARSASARPGVPLRSSIGKVGPSSAMRKERAAAIESAAIATAFAAGTGLRGF